ncbi:MAG: L,D-transpeptidase [Arenimonas sp.]
MFFRTILILITALGCYLPTLALAQGAKASAPIDTPLDELKPGEFIWAPKLVPDGPLVMVISIAEQRGYLYRNGIRIAVTTVSTGKKGNETPTGVFTILQKHKDHRSNKYNDAPMPFMQRLTWDGVALHAGKLPGYPASHGCVRLPYQFARVLFETSDFSMTVIVTDDTTTTTGEGSPGLLVPMEFASGEKVLEAPRLSWFENYRWAPEKAPAGPLSILISTTDQRAIVMRNGIEIGRSKVGITEKTSFGTQAFVLLEGDSDQPSKIVPDKKAKKWMSIPMPGYEPDAAAAKPADATSVKAIDVASAKAIDASLAAAPAASLGKPLEVLDPTVVKRIVVPVDFARSVYDVLTPGTTLVLTDARVLPRTTGKDVTVITAGTPADEELPPWAESSDD